MVCSQCRRANLPGGVRCLYCGTLFPPVEFDLGAAEAAENRPAAGSNTAALQGSPDETANRGRAAGGGLIGTLVLLALKAKTLLAFLKFGKLFLTFGTMLISIAAWSRVFGWKLAAGFVICIFIHEMGHVIVNWRKGIQQTAPMFIPFVGALILIKKFPDDPQFEAESGAGGPVAGGLAALVCFAIGHYTGDPFWYTLAFLGFWMNLFNLIPVWQLDGAHMAAVFSPQVWSAVLVTLLLWALKVPSAFVWALIIFGFVMRLGATDTGRYQIASGPVRARIAALYVVLALVLGWGADQTRLEAPNYDGTGRAVAAQPLGRHASPANESVKIKRPDDLPRDIDEEADTQEDRSIFLSPIGAAILRAFLLIPAALLWLITAGQLAKAANRKMTGGDARLIGGMIALYGLVWAEAAFWSGSVKDGWTLVGAYFAAAVAGLIYAAYSAIRNATTRRRTGIAPSTAFLGARCLAWAAAGALLIAYATDAWLVLPPLALAALLFYGRRPYLLPAVASNAFASLGDSRRSVELLERAAQGAESSGHTDGSASGLWWKVAQKQLGWDRGVEALVALDHYAACIAAETNRDTNTQSVRQTDEWLQRTAALSLQERWDEALGQCEAVLQVASGNAHLGSVMHLLVRVRLARMAQLRGWNDEALAQANWCLKRLSANSRGLRALVQTIRAEALANLPDASPSDAEAALADGLKQNRESDFRAWAATIRAQIALRAGKNEDAIQEAEQARRLLPDHLACRYWAAITRLAVEEDTASAEPDLMALARDFPQEHWGKRAQAEMTPTL